MLNTLVASAVRLCEARFGAVFRLYNDLLHLAAHHNFDEAQLAMLQSWYPMAPNRGHISGRAVLTGIPVQIPDVLADEQYKGQGVKDAGFRSLMGVPLLAGRQGHRRDCNLQEGSRAPSQTSSWPCYQTFADQAVIAIENVRLFEEIQEKSRQLAEASQHKSQFLANMSHELRTPLNAILGYTELIIDNIYGETPAKMRTVLERIDSNGKHLLGLINDVLDLSKIEAGQLTLTLADYSLKDVVRTVFSAVEPLAAEKKLAFKVELPRDLPRGRGDERRLTQVLLNLVGNAIKFTDAGEVAITASSNDGSFNVAVRDTGPGISAADQGKLFQEFQQADNSITKKKAGTGLGLAISKHIIEMHGGRIWSRVRSWGKARPSPSPSRSR